MEIKNRYHTPVTSSTNELLQKLKRTQQLPHGYLVTTDYQTAGKGQQGHCWESEEGKNLLFSLLLYPDGIKVEESFRLIEVVTIGIKRVLERYAKGIKVKWPNDIYWQDNKLGGVLIENGIAGNRITSSVIGIGINLLQQHFVSDAPNPISLCQITQQAIDREVILADMYQSIMSLFDAFDKEKVHEIYLKNLYRNSGYHDYLHTSTGRVFCAKIKAIQSDGGLVLKVRGGEVEVFYFKEVAFL